MFLCYKTEFLQRYQSLQHHVHTDISTLYHFLVYISYTCIIKHVKIYRSYQNIVRVIVRHLLTVGPSWPWSYGSWIYNYLCNQCISLLKLRVWILLIVRILNTTLCDKVCQWLAAGQWFSPPIKRRPQYNWNMVKRVVKHHNPYPDSRTDLLCVQWQTTCISNKQKLLKTKLTIFFICNNKLVAWYSIYHTELEKNNVIF